MKMIVAVDDDWGIGKEGNLLCHIPGDLRYFKEVTTGKTVVMGRKTLESLPGAKGLPDRQNLVLTRNIGYKAKNATVIGSPVDLMKHLNDADIDKNDVFIIGGGSVYNLFLDKCDECFVTHIFSKFDADTHIRNLDEDEMFTKEILGDPVTENGIKYQFLKYTRKGTE